LSITAEKLKSLEEFRSSMEKIYGDTVLTKLDDTVDNSAKCNSTGILGLDYILGGGVGKGRIVEIYGPESSGKTTIALHAIAEVQKQGGTCAFVDAEHAFDPSYAQDLGIQINDLYFSQPDSGEQGLSIVEDFVKSGLFNLVVIDSVSALTPQAELDGEMGDSHMGLQARLMSQACRKITGIIAKKNVTVIFINQLRMKIGVMFGNPETTTGGNALKFYASQRIDVRRVSTINEAGKESEAIANQIRIKIAKNKISPPFRKGEFLIRFGEGIDRYDDLINLAVDYKVIKKAGSWFSYGEERLGQGKEKVINYLKEKESLYEEIYALVKEAMAKAKQEKREAKKPQQRKPIEAPVKTEEIGKEE